MSSTNCVVQKFSRDNEVVLTGNIVKMFVIYAQIVKYHKDSNIRTLTVYSYDYK